MAIGDKYRSEVNGDLAFGAGDKQPFKSALVCDGKKSTFSLNSKTPSQVVEVSKNAYDSGARLQLARAGVLGPMFLLSGNVQPGQKPREFDAEKDLGVSDFELGANQIIGNQEALTIHHKLRNRNYTEPLAVTVWLDAKTKLPLKREI